MMTTTQLDPAAPAEVYDEALRWLIPSRSNPHETYLVELCALPGYDVCQCLHFATKLGPLLARGITPERAVADGLVKIKKWERAEQALQCYHIREANYRFGETCKRLMCARKKESR